MPVAHNVWHPPGMSPIVPANRVDCDVAERLITSCPAGLFPLRRKENCGSIFVVVWNAEPVDFCVMKKRYNSGATHRRVLASFTALVK